MILRPIMFLSFGCLLVRAQTRQKLNCTLRKYMIPSKLPVAVYRYVQIHRKTLKNRLTLANAQSLREFKQYFGKAVEVEVLAYKSLPRELRLYLLTSWVSRYMSFIVLLTLIYPEYLHGAIVGQSESFKSVALVHELFSVCFSYDSQV